MNKIIASCLLALSGSVLFAQESFDDKTLFTVADDTVTAGEYIAVYNKNRNLGEDIDPKTPTEYLDMYINFKLKVHEAKELGMDTMPGFTSEYGSYRDQLAKPYLTDKDVTEELVEQAYDRMQYDVRASHIMVAIPRGASPEDTAKAYDEIMSIKSKIKKGASFSEMAKQFSADTYSAKRGGDLGYFTVFNMVYPFEEAVYTADVGELVGPVKTRFGYHLIKKTDERQARGEIMVNHILIIANEKSTLEQKEAAEKKISEIYGELESGSDFETLAKQYSEDKSTAKNGGRMFPFGINKMYIEFEDAAFGLKNPGDYTEPVQTEVGWHIIQLVKHTGVADKEVAIADIKAKVDRDERSQQSRMSIIKKLKKEYNFREYPKVMKTAFSQIDESFLKGEYMPGKIKNGSKVVFEFANKKYTVEDVITALSKKQGSGNGASLSTALSGNYKAYAEEELVNYEKGMLVKKYPEFRLLSREYYEGILLFDLTEEKVWRKSVSDTTGLKEYYASHTDKYQWKDRYQAYVIDAASAKEAKKAAKMLKKGTAMNEVQKALNAESELNVKIDSSIYEAGTNKIVDGVEKTVGYTKPMEVEGRFFVVGIIKIVPAGGKTYEEARGLVISDYQNYLEEQWIKDLKSRYEVKINDSVLEKVVEKLESDS
ncbi:peptidylprolyl isomerase [Owenweeksia hongkongensis]|uniref:peptidylprolyl isomerase n=1 Tax=Owenweeksia hongkongensis TaxID=253245 RepID=UPI003A905447